MRKAEQILKEKLLSIDDSNIKKNVGDRWEQFRKEESTLAIIDAINTARKEAIEECAERVTLCGKLYCDEDNFSDVEVVNMTNKRGLIDTIIKPDKQSILNLINELK